MKKLILKTALITFVSALVVVAAVFGSLSLFAPAVMSRFTASMGLETLSGDYAYSAYQRSGEIEYLAYSCEVSATHEESVAVKRYEELFAVEGFSVYCGTRDEKVEESMKAYVSTYEQFSYGNYACALYRENRKKDAIKAVLDRSQSPVPKNGALYLLANEGIRKGDKEFCKTLAQRLTESAFANDEHCKTIISDLEVYANE